MTAHECTNYNLLIFIFEWIINSLQFKDEKLQLIMQISTSDSNLRCALLKCAQKTLQLILRSSHLSMYLHDDFQSARAHIMSDVPIKISLTSKVHLSFHISAACAHMLF